MKFRQIIGSALAVTAFAGCSLILDPDNCKDDSECSPGVCQSNICIGARVEPQPLDTGMTDMAGDGDMAIDETPDVNDGGMAIADLGPDILPPDMAVAPEPPECNIISPAANARLLNTSPATIAGSVTDADDGSSGLVVTLGGEMLAIDPQTGAFSIDLPMVEGPNQLELKATDPGGLSCSARLTITLDETAPVIELSQPGRPSQLTRSNPYRLRGQVQDANPGLGLEVLVNDLAPDGLQIDWDGTHFEARIDLQAGLNTVGLTIDDRAGNRSEPIEVQLMLDDEPPSVQIDEPVDNLTTGAADVRVAGHIETDDPAFISQVTVTRTNGADVDREELGANGGDFTTRISLELGDNIIEVCGDDQAGNIGCSTIRVIREDEQPCINFDEGIDNSIIPMPTLPIAGMICPAVIEVTLNIDGGPEIPIDIANERFTSMADLVAPGEHVLTVTARTAQDATAQASITVLYDSSPPTLTINSPQANACLNAQNLRVCGQAEDDDEIDRVVGVFELQMVAGAPDAIGNYCVEVEVPEGEDVTVMVQAFDRAGLNASESITVDIDRTPPLVTMDLAENAWVGVNNLGRVELGGSLDDGTCGVNSLRINGQPALIEADAHFRLQREFPPGLNTIRIQTGDIAGNVGLQMFTFKVDASAPIIDQIVPIDGSLVEAEMIEISMRVCEGESGLNSVTIDGSAAPFEAIDERCFQAALMVEVLEGLNRYSIEVADDVGNQNSVELQIRRDETPPHVTITYPAENDNVEEFAIVEGTATDEDGTGIDSVFVNGVEAELDAESGRWRAVNVPTNGVGAQTFEAITTDLAGNESIPAVRNVMITDYAETDPARKGLDQVSQITWLETSDFNEDGRLDVLALSNDPEGAPGLLIQLDDGTFETRPLPELGLPNTAVADAALGDFDEDGHIDVFIAGAQTNVYLGQGDASFLPSQQAGIPVGLVPTGVAVGDINGNGHLDVLVFSGADTTMLFGDGIGAFQREPLANVGLEDAADYMNGMLVDLTGDAGLDLVAFGPAGSRSWNGNRMGQFNAPPMRMPDVAASHMVAIDADRDADLDFFGTGSLQFFLDNGTGLTATEAMNVDEDGAGAAVADIDGDGRDDLLVYGANGWVVWMNRPAGFQLFDGVPVGLPVVDAATAGLATDIDGDGDFDLLAGGPNGLSLIRSNISVTQSPGYVRLVVKRAVGGDPGPNDAVGVIVSQNLVGGVAPDRALLANPAAPTLVTLGPAEQGDFTIQFVDKGEVGMNLRTIGPINSGETIPANGRE